MNEILFLLHLFFIFIFLIASFKRGKEALLLMVILQALLANLFVQKEIILFGLKVTCTDAFTIGSLIGLNLLREYFGKQSALLAVKLSFCALLFFGVFSKIHLLYSPSSYDHTQAHFQEILGASPRLFIASIVSYIVSQKIDLTFFNFFTHRFPFLIRCSACLLISQLIDTALFSLLGLYGLVHSLLEIIFFSYLIKVFTILILTPCLTLFKKWKPTL